MKPKVLLFDVNETLVNFDSLAPAIEQAVGGSDARKLWFTTMLHHSLVMTAAGQFAPLTEIGAAALQMLAASRGNTLTLEQARSVLAPMPALPAYDDVLPALSRLKAAGIRMAALTNSSLAGMQAQLSSTGIAALLDAQLSVESLRKYKPQAEVYHWACKQMGAAPSDCMMVAAHGWDVGGAKWAGLATAFIARPMQQLFPLAPQPDLVLADLSGLADALGA